MLFISIPFCKYSNTLFSISVEDFIDDDSEDDKIAIADCFILKLDNGNERNRFMNIKNNNILINIE